MSILLTQQKFLLPQVSESLPTFRQVGNYLNSISSASTIFLERDNTHTRLQSDLKLNSNKPSLDLQVAPSLPHKGESDILSYSNTSSLLLFEDSLAYLQKLITLMSSKEHLYNHISQSLAISGFNFESSKSIAKLILQSFAQYTYIASRVDFKLIKQEFNQNTSKSAQSNQQIVSLKQQNLLLFQKLVKFQNETVKYRKKIVSLKEKLKTPTNNFLIINSFKDQCSKIMNKITLFQTEMLQKFIGFQDALIKVTNLRNKLFKASAKTTECNQQSRRYEKQNKKIQVSLQLKASTIERYAMKEIDQNNESNKSQIEQSKRLLKEKSEEILKLKNMLSDLSEQLNDQKDLYEQMLDKNIQLQKQIFMITAKSKPESNSSQSFCIIDQDHQMKYTREDVAEMIESNHIKIFE